MFTDESSFQAVMAASTIAGVERAFEPAPEPAERGVRREGKAGAHRDRHTRIDIRASDPPDWPGSVVTLGARFQREPCGEEDSDRHAA
jgi:hypothetical protein